MRPTTTALGVHLLTASGAVLAMPALVAAGTGAWPAMFLWLLLAFVVDGLDGPLARRYRVRTWAPRFDGALLDLIIDYLTYVVIPAYALFRSGLVPPGLDWALLALIAGASALYFADTQMKTEDGSFWGFPACWNMAVLAIFATTPPPWLSGLVVLALSAAMFAPLRFVHPVRTRRWRALTLPVAGLWVAAAFWAAATGFALPLPGQAVLIAASLYLLLAGIAQQALDRRAAAST